MTHNQFDAILKKRGGFVYITILCTKCPAAIKFGKFPETCPWGRMYEWIGMQKMLLADDHSCLRDEPAVSEVESSYFGSLTKALFAFRAAHPMKPHNLSRGR